MNSKHSTVKTCSFFQSLRIFMLCLTGFSTRRHRALHDKHVGTITIFFKKKNILSKSCLSCIPQVQAFYIYFFRYKKPHLLRFLSSNNTTFLGNFISCLSDLVSAQRSLIFFATLILNSLLLASEHRLLILGTAFA